MIIQMSEKLLLSELERARIDFVRRMVWNSYDEIHDPRLRACLENLNDRLDEFLGFTDYYDIDNDDIDDDDMEEI